MWLGDLLTVVRPHHALDRPPVQVGDAASRWTSGTGQADGHWFRVDMRAPQTFDRIVVDSGTGGDHARGYRLEASMDGTTWTTLVSGSGTGQMLTVPLPVTTARYLRIVQTGTAGNWWSIHELDVYAPAGPVDPDLVRPDTIIDAGPSGTTSHGAAAFEFSSSEPGSTFACSLDGAPFAGCTSPRQLMGLGNGQHRFEVQAIDMAGNVDDSPASRTWTIQGEVADCGALRTVTAVADAWFDQASTSDNKGADSVLKVMSKGPVNNLRAAVRFANPAAPPGCGVESATLRLYAGPARSDRMIEVRRIAATWTESGITWSNQPSTTGPAATASAGTGYREWDVTAQVRAMYESGANHGFLVRDVAENADAEQQYYSREKGESPPQLVIRFAAPAGGGDTTAPDTTIGTKPPALTRSTTARFDFAADEAGATFRCSLDGAPYAPCALPVDLVELGSTVHTFGVRAVDLAGNVDGTPALHTWTVDAVAPETTIDSGPSDPTTSISATIGSASSEPASAFTCSLDGGAYESCASPAQYTGLSVGDHVLLVIATDVAGNADPTPASWSWTVEAPDTTAPETTIDSGPHGTVPSVSATIAFSSEPAASFECRLDGDAFASCTSPVELTGLAQGEHTFRVRATDAAGNIGPSADRSWTVDTIAPVTTIDGGRDDTVGQRTASFTFGSEAGASFECRLDGADFASCQSPVELIDLADGEHTFRVRATDGVGNTGPAASRTWTVVTSGPETTIASGPEGWVSARDATFEFGAGEGVTYECKLAGEAPFASCTSPATWSGLAEGEHTFRVRATDAVGNTGPAAERTWRVDTTPPTTTITERPARHTQARTAAFTFDADGPVERFECKLGGDDLVPFDACTSPHAYTDLADGDYIFKVRAVDRAGNTGDPDSVEWTVDNAPPATTISDGPNASTGANNATFSFDADEAGSRFECRRDDQGTWHECTSPHVYADLGVGAHVFRVRAVDPAGNVGEADTHEWTIVDNDAPITTIGQKPARHTQARRAEFTFDANEPVERFECKLGGDDLIPFEACTSPHAYTDLADGDYIFKVRSVDRAGNTGEPDVFEWSVDNRAPDTTISDGPGGNTQSRNARFTFSADEPVERFECRRDEQADWHACTSPHDYADLAVGAHTFRVRAVDRAGNVGAAATRDWTITPPPPTCDATTVTVEANVDSWVLQSSANKNYGKDSDAKLITKSGGNGRVVVRFPLPALPAGCVVTDAKLRLFANSYKTGRTLQALRLAAGWQELAITWANQPAVAGNPAETPSSRDWVVWSVTPQVNHQYTNGNHGFLVRDKVEGNGGAEQVFNTRERQNNKPRLVITFGPPG